MRRLEERRLLAERALLQNEKLAAVGRLAASISHEINNPLESIGNLLYLVRDADSRDTAREYAMLAEQELARVAQITAQTLSFYRESQNATEHAVEGILASALKLLRSKIAASGVTLKLEMESNARAVRCREGELRQVFINLISNALEATPHSGTVTLRTRGSRRWESGQREAGMRVLIADTGCGMTPAVLARIFEPFYTTKAETGNGLGLWVAKDLVEKHDGFLRVRSSVRPGRCGTVFCVYLPYA
jgi:signal transduction histidine kinase